RRVDVLDAAQGDGGNDLLGRRGDHINGVVCAGLDPLPVDVELCFVAHGLLLMGHIPEVGERYTQMLVVSAALPKRDQAEHAGASTSSVGLYALYYAAAAVARKGGSMGLIVD